MLGVAAADHALGARPSLTASRLGGEWWRGWLVPAARLWPAPSDVGMAAVVAVVQVAGTMGYSRGEPTRWDFDAWAFALLLAGPVALLVRRRWPEATLVVAFVAAAAYVAGGWPRGPAGFPALAVALASAILMGRRAFAWGVLVAAYPAFVGLPSVAPDEVEQVHSLAGRTVNLTWWLPQIGAFAELARVSLERRTERVRAQQDEARRRAAQERLVIARELHDVLAHTISLINVQSGVALHLLDDRPEHARPALTAINEASQEALAGLRSVLDILHQGAAPAPDYSSGDGSDDGPEALAVEPVAAARSAGRRTERRSSEAWVPRAPTSGLRDLDGLLGRTRAAGLDVDLVVDGDIDPVAAPATVDLAAFRIVQESLTNVVRHAGAGARATVRLDRRSSELVVQIDDDAGGHSAGEGEQPAASGSGGATGDGAGRGIEGMRQRALALGGTFAAGPRPGGGFRVRAQLPVEGVQR